MQVVGGSSNGFFDEIRHLDHRLAHRIHRQLYCPSFFDDRTCAGILIPNLRILKGGVVFTAVEHLPAEFLFGRDDLCFFEIETDQRGHFDHLVVKGVALQTPAKKKKDQHEGGRPEHQVCQKGLAEQKPQCLH